MTAKTTDTFTVEQHDRALLEATATALTGLPATAHDTHLAWMATLTPVTSGPVWFSMHGDGYVEIATVDCPGCGRGIHDGQVGNALTLNERIENLLDLAAGPRANLLVRLARRATGTCGTCGPETRSRLAREKYEARPADFVDPEDTLDEDDDDTDGDQDDWVYGGWK
jgi:hypothetical protein